MQPAGAKKHSLKSDFRAKGPRVFSSEGEVQDSKRTASIRRGMERSRKYLQPLHATVCRAVAARYATSTDLVTGQGSKIYGGRWNPPQMCRAVYATFDPYAAIAETLGVYGDYQIPMERQLPLVLVAIKVELQRVLDLTDGDVRRALGVSERRMVTCNWQAIQSAGDESLTQVIGRVAWENGVEGLVVTSARLKKQKNLVVFPDSLSAESRLSVLRKQELPRSR